VAKQLQAAYNKEIEVKKNMGSTNASYHMPAQHSDCPICGVRVNVMDLEVHVDNCLQMFSNDPKKQVEVRDTKQKMEKGFFGKLWNFNSVQKTKTETTKVTTTQSSAPHEIHNEGMQNFYPSPYGYPQFPSHPHQGPNGMPPMMMPMYMYPSYPSTHMTTQLQE